MHPAGFDKADDNYNSCFQASDGKIYYVLCSGEVDVGAQMYSYDPTSGKVTHVGDLTEAAGEKGLKAIPQGKSHVNFIESNGKLYFATHIGYYSPSKDGKEIKGIPPPGYKPYPGGHFMSYDLATGKFEDYGKTPGEGIIDMTMDPQRGRMYGLTWPTGYFLVYDFKTHELKNLGPTTEQGEAGTGATYRVLCRSLALDPDDGSVYFTVATGAIKRYRYDTNSIETLQGVDLKKDVFGTWNPEKYGQMAYNWRQTVWYPQERVFFGMNGSSGYLFRFDPRGPRVDVEERIAAKPSLRSGMWDLFNYGYLGFTLGPDGHTLYYLTGTPRIGVKGVEDIHLVTYDIPTARYIDHGPVILEDGERVPFAQSIAVGRNGRIYTVTKFKRKGHLQVDLIDFPNPLRAR